MACREYVAAELMKELYEASSAAEAISIRDRVFRRLGLKKSPASTFQRDVEIARRRRCPRGYRTCPT